MQQVNARAATRIDLAGGTLDIRPLSCLVDDPVTVNLAVDLPVRVSVDISRDGAFHLQSHDLGVDWNGNFDSTCRSAELPLVGRLVKALWAPHLPPLIISTAALAPAGSGLGGSSALAVAAARAIEHMRHQIDGAPLLEEAQLVRMLADVEAAVIRVPTGVQDYWAALRGGINIIELRPGAERVTTLPARHISRFESELLLCYSGRSRASAAGNWETVRRAVDGDASTLNGLTEIANLAAQCAEAVRDGDFGRVLLLSNREWQTRRSLWPHITTPETDRLEAAALRAGAFFSRLCGAGQGGVMAVFARPEKREGVEKALVANGGIILRAGPTDAGLAVA